MEEMLEQTRASRDHEHQRAVRALEEPAQLPHDLMVTGQKEEFEEQLQLKHAKVEELLHKNRLASKDRCR
eukprot:12921406-Prorocentrum_lima.AAC.1